MLAAQLNPPTKTAGLRQRRFSVLAAVSESIWRDPATQNAAQSHAITLQPSSTTSAERQLSFADQSLDALTSDYVIAASAAEHCAAELARVLRPNAELQLLMHHLDAQPVQLARTTLHQLQRVEQTGLFSSLLALVTLKDASVELAQRTARPLQAALQTIKSAMQSLDFDQAMVFRNALQSARSLLTEHQRGTDVASISRSLIATHAAFTRAEEHARALLDSACDAQQIEQLLAQLRFNGFALVEAYAHYQGEILLGWLALARR